MVVGLVGCLAPAASALLSLLASELHPAVRRQRAEARLEAARAAAASEARIGGGLFLRTCEPAADLQMLQQQAQKLRAAVARRRRGSSMGGRGEAGIVVHYERLLADVEAAIRELGAQGPVEVAKPPPRQEAACATPDAATAVPDGFSTRSASSSLASELTWATGGEFVATPCVYRDMVPMAESPREQNVLRFGGDDGDVCDAWSEADEVAVLPARRSRARSHAVDFGGEGDLDRRLPSI